MTIAFDVVPPVLRLARRWVLRRGKQPINRFGQSRGWNTPAFWLTFGEALEELQAHPNRYDGVGFIVARDPLREGDQILGGDLDCCRDPVTGSVSPWAQDLLRKLDTYTEISPSGCGFRFFCYGKLPDAIDQVMGNGPDDLTEEMRNHILEAKPGAREKLERGVNPFNGFELYEGGPRHLTVTGQHVESYPQTLEHRTAEVLEIIALFLAEETTRKIADEIRRDGESNCGSRGKLPHLDLLDVIDTSGPDWTYSGGQWFGPNPIIGSTQGRNLVVHPSKNVWANMHNQRGNGGDPWLWLACEAGAIRVEDAGPGALRDAPILRRTLKHAIKRGLVTEEILDSWAGVKTSQSDIQVNGRYLHEISADVLKALLRNNTPPQLFVRAGHLARVVLKDRLVIEPLNESALRGLMARAAGFIKFDRLDENGDPIFVKARPPLDVVRDILSLGDWPGLPTISGIIETPVLRSDGSVLVEPGYDAETGLYYAPPPDLLGLEVPEAPSADMAMGAAEHVLSEIFCDFPFKDDASKANALGLLLSVVVRPMIDGNVPLALLDKPQAGTGASFLAEVVAMIATRRPANLMGAPESEEEWRKAITSSLLDGGSVIIIDNVVGKLRSSSLTRALTAQTWRDRLLGKSEMLDLPQRAVWIATGNNLTIGGDIARRSYWIRLDASMARPWLRTGFRHEDLLDWIKLNHVLLLRDLLIMARAWMVAGKPPGSSVVMGGFKEWVDVIGGILEFAGVPSFLANATELYDSMDQDVQQWDEFLEAWSILHADNPITAGQLRDALISTQPVYQTLQNAMPDEVAEAVQKRHRGSLSLGVVLKKHLDQIYPSGRKLCSVKDSHTKTNVWRVAGSLEKQESLPLDGFAGSAGSKSLSRHFLGDSSDSIKYIEREPLPALPADSPVDSDSKNALLPANPGCEPDVTKPPTSPGSSEELASVLERRGLSLACSKCGRPVEGKGHAEVNGAVVCFDCYYAW